MEPITIIMWCSIIIASILALPIILSVLLLLLAGIAYVFVHTADRLIDAHRAYKRNQKQKQKQKEESN